MTKTIIPSAKGIAHLIHFLLSERLAGAFASSTILVEPIRTPPRKLVRSADLRIAEPRRVNQNLPQPALLYRRTQPELMICEQLILMILENLQKYARNTPPGFRELHHPCFVHPCCWQPGIQFGGERLRRFRQGNCS